MDIYKKIKLQHKPKRHKVNLVLGAGERNGSKNVRVLFTHEEKKMQIMKEKKKLRGQDMWITDDLTQYRSMLAFHSRKAVRDGHAHQTWVSSGKSFVKRSETSKPIKIRTTSDIPGFNTSKGDDSQ